MDRCQVRFCTSRSGVDCIQLQHLLNHSAFWAQDREIHDLRTAIEHSSAVISGWLGEQMIGFARATSDGVFRATIWDVVVHPTYQRCGLGKRIIARMLRHPKINRVERVYLMTTHQQDFYESLGFRANASTTMVKFNRAGDASTAATELRRERVYLRENPAAA